jgi:hypothetical protein
MMSKSDYVTSNEGKIGVIFDLEDSQKILELVEFYEVDIYNLIASAIDVMYDCWKNDYE